VRGGGVKTWEDSINNEKVRESSSPGGAAWTGGEKKKRSDEGDGVEGARPCEGVNGSRRGSFGWGTRRRKTHRDTTQLPLVFQEEQRGGKGLKTRGRSSGHSRPFDSETGKRHAKKKKAKDLHDKTSGAVRVGWDVSTRVATGSGGSNQRIIGSATGESLRKKKPSLCGRAGKGLRKFTDLPNKGCCLT